MNRIVSMYRNLRLSPERSEELYKMVLRESEKFGNTQTKSAAEAEGNKEFNRWENVLPYDSTRVTLHTENNDLPSDYINANHVHVAESGRSYILTQGPKPATVAHFWSMIWQQKTTAIVMLCRTVENGVCKCANYWPADTSLDPDSTPDDIDILETDLRIRLLKTTQDRTSDARIRTIDIRHVPSEKSRIVTQYHYLTWPDFGVPDRPDAFLSFVKQIGRNHPSVPGGPNVVHCSAGIGRSGTYCLVDSCLEVASKTKTPVTEKQILDMLLNMRKQRMGLVQTADQLRFAFLALADAMSGMNFEEGFFGKQEPSIDSNRFIAVNPAKSPSSEITKELNPSIDLVSNGLSVHCPEDGRNDKTIDTKKGEAEENGVPIKQALPNQVLHHGSLGRKRSTDFGNEVAMANDNEHNYSGAEVEPSKGQDGSPNASKKLESLAKRKRDC